MCRFRLLAFLQVTLKVCGFWICRNRHTECLYFVIQSMFYLIFDQWFTLSISLHTNTVKGYNIQIFLSFKNIFLIVTYCTFLRNTVCETLIYRNVFNCEDWTGRQKSLLKTEIPRFRVSVRTLQFTPIQCLWEDIFSKFFCSRKYFKVYMSLHYFSYIDVPYRRTREVSCWEGGSKVKSDSFFPELFALQTKDTTPPSAKRFVLLEHRTV